MTDREAEKPSEEGSGQPYVELLAQHERQIYTFIYSLVPNWSDADEIMQETCSTLWECFGDYRPGTNFVAWASQVAYYRVLRHRRKFMRERLIFDFDLDAVAEQLLTAVDDLEERRDALTRCLEKLPEADRLLVSVSYSSGSSVKDFAEQLGRPVKSIYRRLGKIRRRLFDCVRQSYMGEGG